MGALNVSRLASRRPTSSVAHSTVQIVSSIRSPSRLDRLARHDGSPSIASARSASSNAVGSSRHAPRADRASAIASAKIGDLRSAARALSPCARRSGSSGRYGTRTRSERVGARNERDPARIREVAGRATHRDLAEIGREPAHADARERERVGAEPAGQLVELARAGELGRLFRPIARDRQRNRLREPFRVGNARPGASNPRAARRRRSKRFAAMVARDPERTRRGRSTRFKGSSGSSSLASSERVRSTRGSKRNRASLGSFWVRFARIADRLVLAEDADRTRL